MYLALMCVILFASAFVKGLVWPVIVAVLLGMQFPEVITMLIDLLLKWAKIDFSVTKYELAHYIPNLQLGSSQLVLSDNTTTDVSFVMILAVCYIVIFTVASCIVYEKRDIV